MDSPPPRPPEPELSAAGGYPIGVVATLTGLPAEVIRAWERRYGLLRPARTVGGHRLYSTRDVALLRRAAALREQGRSASAACAQALAEAAAPAPVSSPSGSAALTATAGLGARLRAATLAVEARQVSAILAEASALFDVEILWGQVLAPVLGHLGEDWERGTASPAPEHLLSGLVRGRLSTLLEAWLRAPTGPAAVVGCGPGERHDLSTLMLALLLARAGWAVTFLGAETPADALEEVIRAVRPRVALLSATMPEHAAGVQDTLRRIQERLGRQAPLLAYGGPAFAGIPPSPDPLPGCIPLEDDLKAAERQLTSLM